MKVFFLLLCFFMSVEFVKADNQTDKKVAVTLFQCVDGDTAWFLLKGKKYKFRFLAIDTPESIHPAKGVEEYGKDASEYTCYLLKKATKIEIEYDSNSSLTDKYNRQLAWIWLDDKLLEEELLKIGYAKVAYIYNNYKYIDKLCETEKKAYSKKLGIWYNKTYDGYCHNLSFDNSLIKEIFIFIAIFFCSLILYYLKRKNRRLLNWRKS